MKTLTVTVDNSENASLLTKILRSMRFVKKIEESASEYELTSGQIQILEDRLAKYEKGQIRFSDWKDVRKRVSGKK